MRMFPDLFRENRIEPVDSYPDLLRRTLASVAPAKCDGDPTVVILTPGHFNSAYYEHSLPGRPDGGGTGRGAGSVRRGRVRLDAHDRRPAQGGRDLSADRRCLSSTRCASARIRMLGIPGLMDVYRSGGVTICSAPGAGVADDKAVYTYVPEMIRFYLGEEPILKNVPTWQCGKDDDLQLCAGESGGTGGERSARLGRLRDAGRAEIHRGAGRGLCRAGQGRSGQLHRPADAGAVHRADLCRGRRGARAMWTCGPIAWWASGSNWCRAG